MKYPRTYHLPFSPGATKDDKKLKDGWFDFYRGKTIENHNNHPMMMGDGYDTYVANNSEITLLLNKLKEIGKTWDFKEKKLIPLEQ